MKICNKCGETKPLDDFHRQAGKKDGRRTACKECVRAYNKRRQAAEKKAPEVRAASEAQRCLHGHCWRPGEYLPQGFGFRFCDEHVSVARKILDNPTRAWSPAGYALPQGRNT